MPRFNENLKRIMREKGYSLTLLSQVTGIGKSSISQYLAGKNIPVDERIQVLAESLGVSATDLVDRTQPSQVVESEDAVFNVPVEIAAKLMHKKNSFVYEGLKQGVFPWGYAVKTSSTWSYYISSARFAQETGIQVRI